MATIITYRLFTDAEDVVRQFGWYVDTTDEDYAFQRSRQALLDELAKRGVDDFVWIDEELV